MTDPKTEPQTAAGRDLLLAHKRTHDSSYQDVYYPDDAAAAILAIEAEAAEQSVPLDWEAMRKQKGWPTPDSMRNAADGLDQIAIPKYGDILRWVADACDARLVDGAQATPQPRDGSQP